MSISSVRIRNSFFTQMGMGLLTVAFLLGGHAQIFAQSPQARIYNPGDVVEIDGGQTYKIVSCTGTGEWDDCQVQPLVNGVPYGNPVKLSVRNLRAGEERLAKSRGASPPIAPMPPGASPEPEPAPAPFVGAAENPVQASVNDIPASVPVTGAKVDVGCNFNPPGPAVTAASAFSESLAKRKIFDEYGAKANGSASAPLKVGVTFLSVEIGQPYKNTVVNVPGVGAQRLHDGAPVNAIIYTLKSKHVVCEQYKDGSVKRRLVEGSYACFISRHGDWTCPSENDTRITPLE